MFSVIFVYGGKFVLSVFRKFLLMGFVGKFVFLCFLLLVIKCSCCFFVVFNLWKLLVSLVFW